MAGKSAILRHRSAEFTGQLQPVGTGGLVEVDIPPSRNRAGRAGLSRFPLGQGLVEMGALEPGDLAKALAIQQRQDARLGQILLSQGMITEKALIQALSEQWRTDVVALDETPPDPRLIDRWGAGRCLRDGLIPWRKAGAVTVVATSQPDMFLRHIDELEAAFGPVAQAICTEKDLHSAIAHSRSTALAKAAETRVAAPFHCRGIGHARAQRWLMSALCILAALLCTFPVATLSVLMVWAVFSLAVTVSVRIAALIYRVEDVMDRRPAQEASQKPPLITMARLPMISIMIPLFREEDIAGRLLQRLERLRYPRELTDICFVVEASDDKTLLALSQISLPHWIRVITVPKGDVMTKPRALNYALDFCQGSIVGIWDAEDAPAPDQLHKVARRFHQVGADVACLQGRLDFYNARTNWLSRCFAMEYATWFRVLLPGMVKLGFAIPLRGTTLFFRRNALEKIGGWDAHNVTEDADLGIRLARLGYRTEMVDTVTHEEANARTVPWIRQRSRWLKGYAITYAVHMRNPRQLWRDLGAWRFFGVQVVFLCTLSQFLLAPLLWSFWLLVLGLPHFMPSLVGPMGLSALAGIFFMCELVSLAVVGFALHGMGRRWLLPWVPTLHLYFPLAALAAYKGFYELLAKPFYWDKTNHGIFDETCPLPEGEEPKPNAL